MIFKSTVLLSFALYVLCDGHAISEQRIKIIHKEHHKEHNEHQGHHGELSHIGSKKPEHHEEYAWSYPSYEFSYKVHDPHTHDMKGQHESRDGDVVKGEYWLEQPDGRKRTVTYHADKHSGFKATVHYSGDHHHEDHHEHHHEEEKKHEEHHEEKHEEHKHEHKHEEEEKKAAEPQVEEENQEESRAREGEIAGWGVDDGRDTQANSRLREGLISDWGRARTMALTGGSRRHNIKEQPRPEQERPRQDRYPDEHRYDNRHYEKHEDEQKLSGLAELSGLGNYGRRTHDDEERHERKHGDERVGVFTAVRGEAHHGRRPSHNHAERINLSWQDAMRDTQHSPKFYRSTEQHVRPRKNVAAVKVVENYYNPRFSHH